jgi:hypothetical protein
MRALWTIAVAAAMSFVVLCLLMWREANAQTLGAPCGNYEKFKTALAKKYDEHSIGLAENSGAIIEIFKSKAGTITVLVVRPNGVSCIIAAGEHWIESKAVIEGDEL